MAQTEVAAKISKASGPISVERNGKTLELNQGDTVYATDIISTQKSAIELVFTDGAIANLSPNSTLKIQEFSYDTGEDPAFVLSLARGAMRSLSGKLVELNPDAFKVLTPKATAGIRGTEFVTVVRLDGSEQHMLLNIDPGHNFVVTSYGGRQISLSVSGGNIIIAAGSDTDMSEGAITQEEAAQIIREILGTLANSEDLTSDLGSAFEQLQLSASAKIKLQAALEEMLESLIAEAPVILNTDDDSITNDSSGGVEPPSVPDEVEPPSVIVTVLEPDADSGKVSLTITGQKDEFVDGDTPTASFTAISHTISMTGTNEIPDDTVQISCDVNEVKENTTVIGGHDDITGEHIAFSEITGDAFDVEGILTAGNDFMTFSSLLSSSIYGDAKEVDNNGGTTYGSDSIVIKEGISDSSIYADGENYWSTFGGNNSIIVAGTVSESEIYGGGGSDYISVGSVANSSINAGNGSDTITAHIAGNGVEIYVGANDEAKDVVKLTHDVSSEKSVDLFGMEAGDELYVSGNLVTIEASGESIVIGDSLTINFK